MCRVDGRGPKARHAVTQQRQHSLICAIENGVEMLRVYTTGMGLDSGDNGAEKVENMGLRPQAPYQRHLLPHPSAHAMFHSTGELSATMPRNLDSSELALSRYRFRLVGITKPLSGDGHAQLNGLLGNLSVVMLVPSHWVISHF